MNFLTIFARTLPIFFRAFPNFTVSTEGFLQSRPHEKLEFFLTLVNGWNLLPIVTKSSTLDVVQVLDMSLVSEGYVYD